MSRVGELLFWATAAVLLGLAWIHDPWAPPPTRVLAGVSGEPHSIVVRRMQSWVEYRRHEGRWYVAAYSRTADEPDDPYRLADVPAEGEPGFQGLVGHKDALVRRVEGLNALVRDVLAQVAVDRCARVFARGTLDPAAAGFHEGGLRMTVTCGVTEAPYTVRFGAPAPTAEGFYFAVPELDRYGVVAATLVEFVVRLLQRDFEAAGAAAGRTDVRIDGVRTR